MPFFRRGRGGQVAEAPSQPLAATVLGTLPCSERGCEQQTGVECAYVDRRGRRCESAWCPEHRDHVADRVYCRRHAGTVRALQHTGDNAALPDIDNRAPSLVRWIADDLDADVHRTLASTHPEDTLVLDPVRLMFVGPERIRVWERAWKLCKHTGYSMRIAVQVEERDDTTVVVRVGLRQYLRACPPWIDARRNGERLTPEEDAARRQRFHQDLLDGIMDAVREELELEGARH